VSTPVIAMRIARTPQLCMWAHVALKDVEELDVGRGQAAHERPTHAALVLGHVGGEELVSALRVRDDSGVVRVLAAYQCMRANGASEFGDTLIWCRV
jgi:hypothetical protein